MLPISNASCFKRSFDFGDKVFGMSTFQVMCWAPHWLLVDGVFASTVLPLSMRIPLPGTI